MQRLTHALQRDRLHIMLVNIFLNSSAENMRLLQRLFRLRVRTGGDRQHRHQQRVHQRTAEQLSIRLACRQGAEHHFKQAAQISEILAGRKHIAELENLANEPGLVL